MPANDNQGGDWRPVPDPTTLTTAQLLRELGAVRELVFTRIDAIDKATEVLSEAANRTPTEIQKQVAALRDVYDERFASIMERFSERDIRLDQRFAGIGQRFEERDVRTAQASAASDQALNAALQAAKELVNAQGEASAAAAVKSETSFAKQIDQIGTIISTLEKALDARITELKERVDRGEGNTSGVASARTENRLDAGTIISIIAVLLVVASIVIAFVH